MDEVKIGNYIKCSNGNFTQIHGFGHMDPYPITLSVKHHRCVFILIVISPSHLVSIDQRNQSNLFCASDVEIGYTLSGIILENIRCVVRQGLYAPLTYSGDFIANEEIVSNYIDWLS